VRALQKLIRNGTSTQVTIARPLLIQLGWLSGETVIVELMEDESIRVRRPNSSDFPAKRSTHPGSVVTAPVA
jgi:antitoxin component of MazEF toxin-antitoxin module